MNPHWRKRAQRAWHAAVFFGSMGDFDRLAAIATHVGVSTIPLGAEAPRRRCRRRTQGCSLLYVGDVVLAVRSCRVRSLSFFSACRIHAETRGSPDILGRKRDGVRRRRDAGSARDGGDGRGPKDLRDAPYLLASEGQSMAPHRPFSHRLTSSDGHVARILSRKHTHARRRTRAKSRFYISCKLIASLLQQPIWSLHFEINASYWLSQQTCDRLATNVELAKHCSLRACDSNTIIKP